MSSIHPLTPQLRVLREPQKENNTQVHPTQHLSHPRHNRSHDHAIRVVLNLLRSDTHLRKRLRAIRVHPRLWPLSLPLLLLLLRWPRRALLPTRLRPRSPRPPHRGRTRRSRRRRRTRPSTIPLLRMRRLLRIRAAVLLARMRPWTGTMRRRCLRHPRGPRRTRRRSPRAVLVLVLVHAREGRRHAGRGVRHRRTLPSPVSARALCGCCCSSGTARSSAHRVLANVVHDLSPLR